MTFKVGDRVKVVTTASSIPSNLLGKVFYVAYVSSEEIYILRTSNDTDSTLPLHFFNEHLELDDSIQVGDYVEPVPEYEFQETGYFSLDKQIALLIWWKRKGCPPLKVSVVGRRNILFENPDGAGGFTYIGRFRRIGSRSALFPSKYHHVIIKIKQMKAHRAALGYQF